MTDPSQSSHPPGKHRYRSVVEGFELANDFERSRLTISEFARQRGVSFRMVQYWTRRARRLASEAAPSTVQVAEVSADGAVIPVPTRAENPAPTTALPSPVPPTIEVRLPNGVRIGITAGFSPDVLTQVIACLGRPC